MPVRTLRRADGQLFRLGRRRPVVRYPHMALRRYVVRGAEPTPPATCSYAAAAVAALQQMYENDVLGDCVIAAIEHVEGVMTGNANPPSTVYTEAQTTAYYSAACGYVAGDPNTDQGCDIQTVLAYWEQKGFGTANKPMGFLSVDPTNWNEIQLAVWLFMNLIFGVELPDKWINPVPSGSGFVWDVAGSADPENGHCFPGIGYNANQVLISTWGMTGYITQAAIAKYCAAGDEGELYVVLTEDTISKASLLCPAGINWTQLQADFAALSGTSPTPTPTPNPNPNPNPNPHPPPPPPPPPHPTPATGVGSPLWFMENLSIRAYTQLEQAFESPRRAVATVGTPAWLKANLPAAAWSEFVAAVSA